MVVIINRVSVLILSLLISNIVMANDSKPFEVYISNAAIPYGKPLNIKLDIKKSISIDLDKLLKPFNDSLNHSILGQTENRGRIRYKIQVYPTKVGLLKIPELKWNKFKSQSISINVISPITKNKLPIHVVTNKIKQNPWEREQTKIIVTITTPESNIILERRNLVHKGIDSYLIPQKTVLIDNNGKTVYKHTIGWDAFFLYGQQNNFRLPPIEYIKDGVPRYKFHLEKVGFDVKTLPIYVSPTVPVGKITLESKYLERPVFLLQPKETSIIQYSLTGKGVPAKWLPSLSQKYNLNIQSDIRYSHIQTNLSTKIINNNVVGIKTTDIAFTSLVNGYAPFDNLTIQYFDPDHGLLKTLDYKHDKNLILNWFFQLSLLILILYIASKTTIILAKLLYRYMNNHRNISQCKRSMLEASNAVDIKRALNIFSLSQNWPRNLSTNQWLNMFKSKYIVTNEFITAFNKLNAELYANNKDDNDTVKAIKFEILNGLNNLKKPAKNITRLFNLTGLFKNYV